jgi:hypothetical protein
MPPIFNQPDIGTGHLLADIHQDRHAFIQRTETNQIVSKLMRMHQEVSLLGGKIARDPQCLLFRIGMNIGALFNAGVDDDLECGGDRYRRSSRTF